MKAGKVILKGDIAKKVKRGRRKGYYDEKVVEKLKEIWYIMDFMCGKRLKAAMNDVLDNLKKMKR